MGAQSKGNGLAERGGGTTLPPGFVERYCAAVLSADEGLQRNINAELAELFLIDIS